MSALDFSRCAILDGLDMEGVAILLIQDEAYSLPVAEGVRKRPVWSLSLFPMIGSTPTKTVCVHFAAGVVVAGA